MRRTDFNVRIEQKIPTALECNYQYDVVLLHICCNCIPALRELYVCFASTFRFEGFSTLKAYATFVSAIISCLRCAERLTLSIAPIYTQLMMVAVPPLLMNGSG